MQMSKWSILLGIFLLSGCGGGSGSSSEDSSLELTSIHTVEEAEESYKALNSFESIDLSESFDSGYTKRVSTFEKAESVSCRDGGSLSYDVLMDGKQERVSYHECRVDSEYYNGVFTITTESDNRQVIEVSDYTYRDVGGEVYMNITISESMDMDLLTTTLDGVIKQKDITSEVNNISFNDFIIVEKDTYGESWFTMDGVMSVESKCVTGRYQFKTLEKLVETQDDSDNIEMGILEINEARYHFENPYVTITVGGDERTVLQRELEAEMNSSSCEAS